MESIGGGGGGGGLPPPASSMPRYSNPSSSSGGGVTLDSGGDMNRFSYDISQMSDLPQKSLLGHRRAHSEILSLPDDISFDSDLGVVGIAGDGGGPSFSDETEEDLFSMYIDMEKFGASCSTATSTSEPAVVPPPQRPENSTMAGFNDRPRIRHHHSQSMDGSSSIKPELLISGSEGCSFAENKKSISSSKLADLALVDPKRAKRIWANRQSAARSKERKMRYISELERKVQTLQTETTTLSTQLTMLQRDSSGLASENSELKLRLHNMEQQVNLQDALNDALRDEVQRLKHMTGQTIATAGSMMNFGPTHGPSQPFYPNNQGMHSLITAHQFQQLQIQSQQSHQHQFQHQLQQQLQQQTGDLKLKGSLPFPSQRGASSNNNNPSVNGLRDQALRD